jgi:hypothetical protein
VSTFPGTFRFHNQDLSFSAVAAVITSRVSRKQGLASRLTAWAIAEAATAGAVVSGLGMFDQGFYDKLGYGHGGYDHYVMLDPSLLNVPHTRNVPVRLGPEDAEEMHRARMQRLRWHGAVTFTSSATTALMSRRSDSAFGLGFRDADGNLTHHLWINPDRAGSGPYKVLWMAYTNLSQFIELLGLLRNLGDQVYLVRLVEPGGVQLQDFLDRPFRRHAEAKGGSFETYSSAVASFQYRILDVPKAMDAVCSAVEAEFTLRLADPVERYLPEHSWPGVGGDYQVTLGETGGARAIPATPGGVDVSADVGTFTRLWLGVLPATTLRETGRLECNADTARLLDQAFFHEPPHTDWPY